MRSDVSRVTSHVHVDVSRRAHGLAAVTSEPRVRTIFLTGATGLVGGAVLERLLDRRDAHVIVLIRRPDSWRALATRLGARAARVTALPGDVTQRGLGLPSDARRDLARSVSHVVHCAADTSFSRPLEGARTINTMGTAHLLDVLTDWRVERLVHVSTAFVAGRRVGAVPEAPLGETSGFVNAYEQSKHEAEALVRASRVPHAIVRPSTIVCDDASGRVSQYNAVHRALRAFYAGYGSIMPGAADTPIDLVTTSFVAVGVVAITEAAGASGTLHLCAGAGALTLGEVLERAHAVWSRDPRWRRRGIERPALTDLATYRLFEDAVAQTGDARLAAITRSLSHFVPQLAYPKHFETARADALLGRAVPVRVFWDRVLTQLVATRWGALRRRAA